MDQPKINPVDSIENLRERVDRFFRGPRSRCARSVQLPLKLKTTLRNPESVAQPSKSLAEYLNFMVDAVPDGEVYLFGGLLRDVALLGNRGFNSDVDVVVDGRWEHIVRYLHSSGATRNKFGGYRVTVAGWPVDIWSASETWAIKHHLVDYRGIASLTDTTVLNWDAILMNWRTRAFVHRDRYFEQLRGRVLDIVLMGNPNPLGMATRVFRHLCLKDAKQITRHAAAYLAESALKYSFEDIRDAELRSYRQSVVDWRVYRLFKQLGLRGNEPCDIKSRYGIATNILALELDLD